jgi:hypothetical protein
MRRIELKFVFGEYWRSRSGVDPDDPDLTFITTNLHQTNKVRP